MQDKPHVCLVSPGHVASNPRLVKEADALQNSGRYQVTVIASNKLDWVARLDQSILNHVGWRVCLLEKNWVDFFYKLRRKISRKINDLWVGFGAKPGLSLSLWAHHEDSGRLAIAASKVHADLYIAHNLAALPAVAFAAAQQRTGFAFDAEDSHVDQLSDEPQLRAEKLGREKIERCFLPRARYISSASPGIADALKKRYGLDSQVVLNTFPLAHMPDELKQTDHVLTRFGPDTKIRLYWFSQTIGPDRGLEELIVIIKSLNREFELSLLGHIDPGFRKKLALSQTDALRINFLGTDDPDKMPHLAAGHHAGLSLELRQPHNRDICLTNKIFTYLLAGLPVIMSRTTAHENMLKKLGCAGLLIDLDDPVSSSEKLSEFFSDQSRWQRASRRALRLARKRYNWDLESARFLRLVEQSL